MKASAAREFRFYKGFTSERVAALSPASLACFLEQTGFLEVTLPLRGPQKQARIFRWSSSTNVVHDVLVPLNTLDYTYFLRYVEAIHDLGEILSITPEQVFQTLLEIEEGRSEPEQASTIVFESMLEEMARASEEGDAVAAAYAAGYAVGIATTHYTGLAEEDPKRKTWERRIRQIREAL